MHKYVLAVIFLLSGIVICHEECFGLAIGPSRLEVSLPQGETAGADYYVQNDSEEPVHVVVEPENWYPDVYNYKNLPITDWVEIDAKEFELQPKEIRKIKVIIRVPADAAGELVAQIFFSSASSKAEDEAGSGIQTRLGAVLYVAIKGTEKVDAEVLGVSTTKTAQDEKAVLSMDTTILNKGNVHLRPLGQIAIVDDKGNKIGEADMISGRAVLPNQTFIYNSIYKGPELKTGKYKLVARVTYGEIYGMEKAITYEQALEIGKNGEVVKK